jgi:hypothetical protein
VSSSQYCEEVENAIQVNISLSERTTLCPSLYPSLYPSFYPSFNPNNIMKFYMRWCFMMNERSIDCFGLKEDLINISVSSYGKSVTTLTLTCKRTGSWVTRMISGTYYCGLNPS